MLPKLPAKQPRIVWLDVLRLCAIFMVICIHCSDPFNVSPEARSNPEFNLWGGIYGSFLRPCVPLFVMITGILLLPVKMSFEDFYKKRLLRIAVPFLLWSVLYNLFPWLTGVLGLPQSTMSDVFAYAPIDASQSFSDAIKNIALIPFQFNVYTVPMWYLYMLIGLYLLMPVLSPWLAKASKGDLELVLKIWGVSLVLPYVKMFAPLAGYTGNWGNMNILGVCDWNDYGTFYYFSGFVGYLILAYYLRRYPLDWSWRKMLMITVPMFLVGYVITAYGYVMTQYYFPGNYAYLEIVWYFAGINVFMMTFPVFVIVQKLNARNRSWLSRLASYTFGIYLCHFIFVFMCFDLYDVDGLPYLIRIICTALTSFALSAIVVALMSSWKLTARFVR